MTQVGFDAICNLRLNAGDSFNWVNKAASLYCIVTGNVSSDLRTIKQTLAHLSRFYQGIFYIPGELEYKGFEEDITARTIEIITELSVFPEVVVLYQNVVILDGVAIVGVTGSKVNLESSLETSYFKAGLEDLTYLDSAISKLQKHLDVKRILVISNAVPDEALFFDKQSKSNDQLYLSSVLDKDSESKVSHWVYDQTEHYTEVMIGGVNYISNPKPKKGIYWAKRITIDI